MGVKGDVPSDDYGNEWMAWLQKIQFLSDAMESTSQPFCAAGRDGSILIFNEAFCRLTGYTREELYDINWATDLTTAESLENEFKALDALDRTHKPQRYEKYYRRKDGSEIPVELSIDLAADSKDRVLFYYGFITDITERKRVEDELTRLASIVTFSDDAIIGKSLDGVISSWNKGAERLYGYSAAEALGKYIGIIIPPDRIQELHEILNKIRRGERVEHHETVRVTKDRRRIDVSVTVTTIVDKAGNLIGAYTITRDITERKRAEEAVKFANAYNRSLIEASLDPLVTIAPDGRITDVNTATEAVTGYPREKLVGTDFSEYFTDPAKAREGYRQVFEKGSVTDYPLEIKRRDGHITPVLYNATVYRDDKGKVIGVFAAARDITERKRAEAGLEEAKAQAEMYVDLMSHDIRNYNMTAAGFLELTLDTLELDEGERELLSKPLESINASSRLIDSIVKLQKVKGGKALKKKPIDLCDVLAIIKANYSNAPDRQVTIKFKPVPECLINANELVYDVFSNLVSNAIKHTDPDKPLIINFRIESLTVEGKMYVKASVEDDGPGIPDDLKSRLYGKYERGMTKASGRGLGLYLVKTLVEDYGGKVWIEDRVPGDYTKGTRFVVLLPAAEMTGEEPAMQAQT